MCDTHFFQFPFWNIKIQKLLNEVSHLSVINWGNVENVLESMISNVTEDFELY